LALLLGLLAAPIILLYMLRLRRMETPVSSTLLWQKLLRDREANAPWQRLRRNLLLILQLLILAALALALARPFLPVPSVVSGSVVVLLDGSASMLATDVQPSRFDAARAEVQGWIDDLGGDDAMTLILVGRTPTVLSPAGNDPQALHRALAEARAQPVSADWAAALALASGAAQGYEDARIVIVSDGGLPGDPSAQLPALPGEVVYVPIGEGSANLALSALATRGGVDGVQLLAAVSNYGAAAQEALVSIFVNDALFDARRVSVPASGEPHSLTWQLPDDAVTVRAELSEQAEDHLALDDHAWAVNASGAGTRALLATPGNVFLEQVLGLLPDVTTVRAAPDAALTDGDGASGGADYDLYVYDGVALPDPPPAGDLLLIDPPNGGELFSVGAVFSDTNVVRLADSPLLQFVEWRGVNVRAAHAVSAPWAQPVVEAAGGPLLLAGETGGRRVAILTFDLHDSDLPLRVAFPVLMANIVTWLSPGQALDFSGSLQPGQPAALSPGAGASAVLVQKPDGEQRVLTVEEAQTLLFEETDQPGIYTVLVRESAGQEADRLAGRFAVNLFAPEESDIAPAPALQLGQRTVDAPQAGDVGRREFWPWLAALALIILIVEWWVHFQGPRLPDLKQLAQRISSR
jgi:hypothetical protein